MEQWPIKYVEECGGVEGAPSITQWILLAVQKAMATQENVDQIKLEIAVGPVLKVHYYGMCWAYGRHFRVMARDLNKKTTLDYGISTMYNMNGEGVEFFGYIESIVRMNFDNVAETVLSKGRFWDSVIRQHGPNRTVMVDDYGLMRVKIDQVLSNYKASNKPFINPKDINQVFYIDDCMNPGWKLVVNVNPRRNLVVYRRQLHS